ncbi:MULTISPECIES: hypothetical protein [Streptomyces]|uniref:hypothetical protein n=1 Tax=Streptomyces TaxID=1883 RepID=UPI000F6E7353|nr:hypothetical protein [Streptomyces sp. W1SF4]AZM89659.1 hypothetical protein D1J60_15300 [Streptomyces sp. W1SF4]
MRRPGYLVRGALATASAAGILMAMAGPASAAAAVPWFKVDGVGTPLAGGTPQLGVPYASKGTMTDDDTDAVTGTSYRFCVVEEVGANFDKHLCTINFRWNNGSQISATVLVEAPHAGVEAKAFDGVVTGGSGLYEGTTGYVHYEPVAGTPNKYTVSVP